MRVAMESSSVLFFVVRQEPRETSKPEVERKRFRPPLLALLPPAAIYDLCASESTSSGIDSAETQMVIC